MVVFFLLWLVVLTGLCQAKQDLFVLKRGSRFTTQSKWLTTFTLQIKPYQVQLEHLEISIADISRIINHYKQEALASDDKNAKFFDMLVQRVQSSKKQLSHIKYYLNNTVQLMQTDEQKRAKRSLLPFLGHFLSGLTGTATEDDIRMLNDKLNQIGANDKQFRHILKDSLTIVNTTQAKLKTFQKSINHIIENINDLVADYENITTLTLTELRKEEYKATIYATVNNYLLQFDRGINLLSTDLIRFDIRLNDLLHHQVSPRLISSPELASLLNDITVNLDRQLQLPFDIKSDLTSYYKYLTCDSFPAEDGIGVVLAIPLLSTTDRIDLYEIVSFPVPYADGHLQLQHQVDSNYVAMSHDKNRIAFLDHDNFLMCTNEQTVICHILAPFHAIHALNHSCASTLITTNSLQDCPVTVQKSTIIDPQAISLDAGKWAVVTSEAIEFCLMCPHHPSRKIIIAPPTGLLHLPLGCSARSLLLSMPPTYMTSRVVRYENVSEFAEVNFTIIKQVPQSVHHMSLTTPKRLAGMIDGPITIAQLQQQLEDLPWYSPSAITSFWAEHWFTVTVGAVIVSIIVMVLVAFCVYRRCSCHAMKQPTAPPLPVSSFQGVGATTSLYPSLQAAAEILHAFPQTSS